MRSLDFRSTIVRLYPYSDGMVVEEATDPSTSHRLAWDEVHGDAHIQVVPEDAFVVERGSAPRFVAVNRTSRVLTAEDDTSAAPRTLDPRALRYEAGVLLAAAEYLDGNPPVDEVQIAAMADDLLGEVYNASMAAEARRMAERAIRAGWTKPEVKP